MKQLPVRGDMPAARRHSAIPYAASLLSLWEDAVGSREAHLQWNDVARFLHPLLAVDDIGTTLA